MKVEYGDIVKGKKFFKTSSKPTEIRDDEIISLRVNKGEQEKIKELMRVFGLKTKSKAIKKAINSMYNVLHGT